MALPLALLSSLAVASLVATFLGVAGMEPAIAVNLRDETRARHLADAGVEWALDRLAATPDWSALLGGVPLIAPTPLPGRPATEGTVAVTLRNDDRVADAQVTGVAADPGGPAADTNGVVIVTSTGTTNGVSRVLQAVLRRPGGPGTTATTVAYWQER